MNFNIIKKVYYFYWNNKDYAVTKLLIKYTLITIICYMILIKQNNLRGLDAFPKNKIVCGILILLHNLLTRNLSKDDN